jgi:hypothetical protein
MKSVLCASSLIIVWSKPTQEFGAEKRRENDGKHCLEKKECLWRDLARPIGIGGWICVCRAAGGNLRKAIGDGFACESLAKSTADSLGQIQADDVLYILISAPKKLIKVKYSRNPEPARRNHGRNVGEDLDMCDFPMADIDCPLPQSSSAAD